MYNYEIAFGGIARILVNPVERILAEKLSTFAIYGTDNTRAKDLFDAYWIINHYQFDKKIVIKILNTIIVTRSHYFKTIELGKKAISSALSNPDFKSTLATSKRNWTGANIDIVIKTIMDFLFRR